MSERTERVKTCDVCGKRVSDEGCGRLQYYRLGKPVADHHLGWFSLNRLGGVIADGSYSKTETWDLCDLDCLKALVRERLSSPSKETLL